MIIFRTIFAMIDSEDVLILRIYMDDLARVSLQSGFTRQTYTTYAWQIPRGYWTHVACTVRLLLVSHSLRRRKCNCHPHGGFNFLLWYVKSSVFIKKNLVPGAISSPTVVSLWIAYHLRKFLWTVKQNTPRWFSRLELNVVVLTYRESELFGVL